MQSSQKEAGVAGYGIMETLAVKLLSGAGASFQKIAGKLILVRRSGRPIAEEHDDPVKVIAAPREREGSALEVFNRKKPDFGPRQIDQGDSVSRGLA